MNPHHHHNHPHPPLFVMCPCRCRHHRHYHSYHLHQHQPQRLVPPPPTSNMTPPLFVPPTGGSSYPVQHQTSDPAGVSEAGTAGFPSERSQEVEWSEDQVFEEDEEVVFVLTDEWAEFFARSEAKRKSAKQQKRKGAK